MCSAFCVTSSGKYWPQQVVSWIVQGSHPLSSGSSCSYFGCHFCCHVSWAVVTSVVKQDLPRHQLGSLVILVVTLSSFSSLGLNHGDNEYQRSSLLSHGLSVMSWEAVTRQSWVVKGVVKVSSQLVIRVVKVSLWLVFTVIKCHHNWSSGSYKGRER